MFRTKKTMLILCIALAMLIAFSGFGMANRIEVGYVQWECAIAQTHIVAAVLEEYFDMDVELMAVEAGMMWSGVSRGDIDVLVCAWLPVTHSSYYDQYGDDVVSLGANFDGARIGLVVPDYVDIDSIEELNDHAANFNEQIVGIDPGAGIMQSTEQAIEDYDLNLELIEATDFIMVTELASSISDGDWVVVTGWEPHWKFDEYDLRFLEDPKGLYGAIESINTIVRKGFFSDFDGGVSEFFANFYLTSDELGEMMGMVEEKRDQMSELEIARIWVENNQDIVSTWLP